MASFPVEAVIDQAGRIVLSNDYGSYTEARDNFTGSIE
jgi:hypothetical protein